MCVCVWGGGGGAEWKRGQHALVLMCLFVEDCLFIAIMCTIYCLLISDVLTMEWDSGVLNWPNVLVTSCLPSATSLTRIG